jgi:hypothetical protein
MDKVQKHNSFNNQVQLVFGAKVVCITETCNLQFILIV